MIRILLLGCFVLGWEVSAGVWRPSDSFLDAVRFVESSHGRFVRGDNGRSLGDFQLSEAAWYDVTAWRKARGLGTYSYDAHVLNPAINRLYAADFFTILHGRLRHRMKRTPSPGELYAAYNMGFGSFARCQFRLSRVNAVTVRKCREIHAILGIP